MRIEYGNSQKTSTWFPDDWSRIKVIEKIFEAINDSARTFEFDKTKQNLIIRGATKDGMVIEVIFDQSRNNIKSAYPWIKKL